MLETGPVCTMRARNGDGDGAHVQVHDTVISELRRAEADSHFRVYLKHEIPERFHWKNNRRTPDVLVLCGEHYCAVRNVPRPK